MSRLVSWASHEFKLNQTHSEGITIREHLEQVEKQIGRKPKELVNPNEFPLVLAYIWSAFISLSRGRTIGFSGPNPLTYPDIESWMRLTGTPLNSRDIEAVKTLDNEYIRICNG